jgi:hypothetical protein
MSDASVNMREVVEELKTGLVRRATGGAFEDDEYRRLRKILLGSSLASLVPEFVQKSRDLGDSGSSFNRCSRVIESAAATSTSILRSC